MTTTATTTDSATLQKSICDLRDGALVTLYPKPGNPLHRRPIAALYREGYFYCDGSPIEEGPDYNFRDVLEHNFGWVVNQPPQ